MDVFQVLSQLCSCSMACWPIPVTGSRTFPTTAWASSWQTRVLTCGWGTAGETPGLGDTRLYPLLRTSSGLSGRLELTMTGAYFLSTLTTDTRGGRWMGSSRLSERGDGYLGKGFKPYEEFGKSQ